MSVRSRQSGDGTVVAPADQQAPERILAEFSREAGHTLNTRIANVEIAMSVVRRALGGRRAQAFANLENAVELLKNVSQNAMRFGKAWHDPKLAPFDLTELLDALRLRYRGRRFTWSMPRAVTIVADREMIESATVELLDNARRFAPRRGGKITVKMYRKNVRRSAKGAGPEIVIDVRDNGKGVPKRRKKLIFQPYLSSDRAHFGLGLSIVERVAEAHGGTAEERGRAGKGALFRIALPQ